MNIAVYNSVKGCFEIETGFVVDGDGSPRCYGPNNSGLDYNANGGPPHAPYGYELNPETGNPFIQGFDAPAYSEKTKGMYVSSTTYMNEGFKANDPRAYLNSEIVNFAVITGSFRKHCPGVALGGYFTCTYKGKTAEGVMGDVGPNFGEGSIALANELDIDSDPRYGGTTNGCLWCFYPGRVAPGFILKPYHSN